jgi:photosystem II stability/assembly factor-like uncharacterized protein
MSGLYNNNYGYNYVVLKSTNSGNDWLEIPGSTPWRYNEYFYAIVIDANSPNKVYGCNYRGVYRSADSGQTWFKNNGWAYGCQLAIDPNNGNTIYSGYYDRIYRSVDGGINWSPYNNGLVGYCESLLIDHSNTETIYYGSNVGAFKSVDGGRNWQAKNSLLVASDIPNVAIAPSEPRTIYIEFSNNGIYKSTNSGDSWISLPGSDVCNGLGALVVDHNSPDIVYALESG